MKTNFKRVFFISLICLIGVGLGIGFTLGELTRYDFVNEIPTFYELTPKKIEFEYHDGLYFAGYYGEELVDNKLPDGKIVVQYNDSKYSKTTVYEKANMLVASVDVLSVDREFFDEFIKLLQEKKIYSFTMDEIYEIKIYANDKTWKKMYENEDKVINERLSNYEDCRYAVEAQYESRIRSLELENEHLEEQLELYKERLENLREALNN